MYFTTELNQSQEEFYNSLMNCKKSRKFRKKKIQSLRVADSFKRLGEINRSLRMRFCGDSLGFLRLNNGEYKLMRSDHCRERLCPTCSWLRSLRTFAEVSAVMNELGDKYRYLFLTLTIPNCKSNVLSDTIRKLLYDYKRLTQTVDYKRAVMGNFRALEVTYNRERDDFHPHIHSILAVPPHYFSDPRLYIDICKWVNLWTDITAYRHVNVDIRAFAPSADGVNKEICECAKYTVKTSDLIARLDNGKIDIATTDYLVKTMHEALRCKRLIGYGGIMRDVHRNNLRLKNMECDINCECDLFLRPDVMEMVEWFRWGVGFEGYNYYRVY